MHTYLKASSIASLLFLWWVGINTASCNNEQQPATVDTASITSPQANNTQPSSTGVLPERERLIRALQKLQQDFATKDKEAIAAYFRFPVESDALQAFDVNPTFDKAVQQANHQISQQLFFTHFTALYTNLEMQGLNEVFTHIQLNKLKDTALKQVEARKTIEVCKHYYNITIEGREVTLQYGVYTDNDDPGKQPSEEMECAEYAAFWTFIFDGEKLIFNRHQVAG